MARRVAEPAELQVPKALRKHSTITTTFPYRTVAPVIRVHTISGLRQLAIGGERSINARIPGKPSAQLHPLLPDPAGVEGEHRLQRRTE